MVYTEFSTKKADYVLQLGLHDRENKQIDIFEGIDAFVIETGRSRLENFLLQGHPQYNIAIKYCRNNGLPIFGTDVRCCAPTRATFAGAITVELIDEILAEICPRYRSYSFSEKKLNKLFSMLYSNYFFAIQDPMIEARNAVNARKIEEFVVDRVREITGKKKPKIGLIFGTAHVSLEQNLRSKLRRDITLWNYKNLNFKRYAGLDRKELNKIYEGRFEGQDLSVLLKSTRLSNQFWQFNEHMVNLFK